MSVARHRESKSNTYLERVLDALAMTGSASQQDTLSTPTLPESEAL